jgi:hypothetical protein
MTFDNEIQLVDPYDIEEIRQAINEEIIRIQRQNSTPEEALAPDVLGQEDTSRLAILHMINRREPLLFRFYGGGEISINVTEDGIMESSHIPINP